MKILFGSVLFITSLAVQAQQPPQDFASLVNENHFSIPLKSRSTLKVDSTNFTIKQDDRREEFSFNLNDVKTPRKLPFAPHSQFKLQVDRNKDQQVERITSRSYINDQANAKKGQQTSQSTSVDEDGYVNSHTVCREDYKLNFLGMKSKKSGYLCVTISPVICKFIKDNKIDEAMVAEFKECNTTFSNLAKFQEGINKEAPKTADKDISAIRDVAGGGDYRKFYELEAKTLSNLSEMIAGYEEAIGQCNKLTSDGYLPPENEKKEVKAEKEKRKNSSKQ